MNTVLHNILNNDFVPSRKRETEQRKHASPNKPKHRIVQDLIRTRRWSRQRKVEQKGFEGNKLYEKVNNENGSLGSQNKNKISNATTPVISNIFHELKCAKSAIKRHENLPEIGYSGKKEITARPEEEKCDVRNIRLVQRRKERMARRMVDAVSTLELPPHLSIYHCLNDGEKFREELWQKAADVQADIQASNALNDETDTSILDQSNVSLIGSCHKRSNSDPNISFILNQSAITLDFNDHKEHCGPIDITFEEDEQIKGTELPKANEHNKTGDIEGAEVVDKNKKELNVFEGMFAHSKGIDLLEKSLEHPTQKKLHEKTFGNKISVKSLQGSIKSRKEDDVDTKGTRIQKKSTEVYKGVDQFEERNKNMTLNAMFAQSADVFKLLDHPKESHANIEKVDLLDESSQHSEVASPEADDFTTRTPPTASGTVKSKSECVSSPLTTQGKKLINENPTQVEATNEGRSSVQQLRMWLAQTANEKKNCGEVNRFKKSQTSPTNCINDGVGTPDSSITTRRPNSAENTPSSKLEKVDQTPKRNNRQSRSALPSPRTPRSRSWNPNHNRLRALKRVVLISPSDESTPENFQKNEVKKCEQVSCPIKTSPVEATEDGFAKVKHISKEVSCLIKTIPVKATENGFAKVKDISKWLSEDAFNKKKTGPVRSGSLVIRKSRKFEPANITRATKDIEGAAAKVSDRSKWLRGAFQKDENSEPEFGGRAPSIVYDDGTDDEGTSIGTLDSMESLNKVMSVARAFGGSAKKERPKKTAFQIRREEFEKIRRRSQGATNEVCPTQHF